LKWKKLVQMIPSLAQMISKLIKNSYGGLSSPVYFLNRIKECQKY
jgi:hypothetical protein